MKPRNIGRKLELKKQTLVDLTISTQNDIRGGEPWTSYHINICGTRCQTGYCCGIMQPTFGSDCCTIKCEEEDGDVLDKTLDGACNY